MTNNNSHIPSILRHVFRNIENIGNPEISSRQLMLSNNYLTSLNNHLMTSSISSVNSTGTFAHLEYDDMENNNIVKLSTSLRVFGDELNEIKSDDSVIIPQNEGNILLSFENDYIVKIKSVGHEKNMYAKVINFNAKIGRIIMSDKMKKELNIENGDRIYVESVKLENITKIKFKVPKIMVNPNAILEFELKNKNILSKGDMIESNIFDKKYVCTVMEIYSSDKTIDIGLLYGTGTTSDITLEIESEK